MATLNNQRVGHVDSQMKENYMEHIRRILNYQRLYPMNILLKPIQSP